MLPLQPHTILSCFYKTLTYYILFKVFCNSYSTRAFGSVKLWKLFLCPFCYNSRNPIIATVIDKVPALSINAFLDGSVSKGSGYAGQNVTDP